MSPFEVMTGSFKFTNENATPFAQVISPRNENSRNSSSIEAAEKINSFQIAQFSTNNVSPLANTGFLYDLQLSD